MVLSLWPTQKGKREPVVQRVREAEDEHCHVKGVGLDSQALERSLSWNELWETAQGKLMSSNLKIWGKAEQPSCKQYGLSSAVYTEYLDGMPQSTGRWTTQVLYCTRQGTDRSQC